MKVDLSKAVNAKVDLFLTIFPILKGVPKNVGMPRVTLPHPITFYPRLCHIVKRRRIVYIKI